MHPSEHQNEERLKALDAALEKAKERQVEAEEPSAGAGAMRVGAELGAGVLVGAFIGYMLDKWLGTLPLFFLLCFFIGAAGGWVNVIRSAKNGQPE